MYKYYRYMARGFESKSVEAQQEEAARGRQLVRPPLSAEALAAEERRRILALALRRAEDDLTRAIAPPHRHMLEQAIGALKVQLEELAPPSRLA
jgi:hypothetical protein